MQKRAEKGNQLFQMCSCALTLLCSCCIERESNNRVDAEHERQMESKDFNQLFRLCSVRWGSAVLNMEQGCTTGRRSIEEMQSTWANMVLVPELNGDLLLWAGEPKPACFCTCPQFSTLGIHLCNLALNSYSASSISVSQLIRRFLAILNDASVDDDIPGIPRRLHHGSIFYLLHLAQPPSFEFATRRPLNMVATSHRARDISNVFIARSPQTKSRWSTNLNWQLWPFLVDQNRSRNQKEKLNLPKYCQLDDTTYLA